MKDPHVRLPQALLDRAESLAKRAKVKPELLAYATPSRAAIIRLAIGMGLESLRRELDPFEVTDDIPF